ncbi:MAG: hypothetical protein KJ709_04105 [Nanoarchaeota archaeon]|nr:hypothetical protein [Nanoarchaeota archaeon]
MAKRITIADEKELERFADLDWREKSHHIFYLDACAVSENLKIMEGLLKTGNFRIADVALQELKDWKEPVSWHYWDKKRWAKVQEITQEIEQRWPKNIEHVDDQDLYDQLIMLEPLLSKTLVFRRLETGFSGPKGIYSIIRDGRMSPDSFMKVLRSRWVHVIWREFKKEVRKQRFKIHDIDSFKGMIERDVILSLKQMLRFLFKQIREEGYGEERVLSTLQKLFKKKVKNDALVVAHYLLSKERFKHLPAEDKDTFELAMLHRDMVFA